MRRMSMLIPMPEQAQMHQKDGLGIGKLRASIMILLQMTSGTQMFIKKLVHFMIRQRQITHIPIQAPSEWLINLMKSKKGGQ